MSGEEEKILQQLLARLDSFTDMKVSLGVLANQVAQLVEGQHELAAAIKGNGKPGLNDRVKDLEYAVHQHPLVCSAVEFAEEYKQDKEDKHEEEQQRRKEVFTWKLGMAASLILLVLDILRDVLMRVPAK